MMRWLVLALGLVGAKVHAQECVERQPITAFIALDASGSMDGAGQEVAGSFAIALLQALENTGHLSEAQAYRFDSAHVETGFQSDLTAVYAFFDGYKGATLSGSTALHQAIIDAANKTHAEPPPTNFKLAVILTDGANSGGTPTEQQVITSLGNAPDVKFELIHAGSGDLSAFTNFVNSGSWHINARSADLTAPRAVTSIRTTPRPADDARGSSPSTTSTVVRSTSPGRSSRRPRPRRSSLRRLSRRGPATPSRGPPTAPTSVRGT